MGDLQLTAELRRGTRVGWECSDRAEASVLSFWAPGKTSSLPIFPSPDFHCHWNLPNPLLTPQGPDTSTPDQHVPLGFIG